MLKSLPVTLSKTVEKYKGYGRMLGYPTANVDVQVNLTDGVYFGYASLASFKNHPALIFIGTPTTIGDKDRRIEAHLLDVPDKDYYGLKLNLRIEHYHRANEHFNNINELIKVMKADEVAARKWFSRNS